MAASLLEKLSNASGLSKVFAEATVRRIAGRAGVDPENLRRQDIERLLPMLKHALLLYLDKSVAEARLRDIQKLAESD